VLAGETPDPKTLKPRRGCAPIEVQKPKNLQPKTTAKSKSITQAAKIFVRLY